MPLTRVTSGVITSNAITTDKIAPGAVDASSISSLATLSAVSLSASQLTVSSVNYSDRSIQSTASYTGFRNRIINGDMRIDQRNAGASVTQTVAVAFPVDRFFIYGTVTSKFTAQRNAGSVTPPAGFTNYLGISSSSAYSVDASDYFAIYHRIEGNNVADLGWGAAGAASVTLSFWVRSSLTGTHGGVITNSASNRSYPFSYTISAANTWEQKAITIPGDTTGTWLTDTGTGIAVQFNLGTGSTFSGTANSWQAGNFVAPTGATSVVGTNGATFYVTGVQLEVGTAATPFERRQFGQELALCQRYYEKNEPGATNGVYALGYSTANNAARYVLFFKATKRATPTISVSSGTDFYGQTGVGGNIATATLAGSVAALNQTGLGASFGGTSFTAGQGSQLLDNNSGNSWIAASAEL